MTARFRLHVLATLLSVFALASLTGCSVLGLTAGIVADARNRRPMEDPASRLDEIARGRPIALVLAGGDTLSGRFHRLVTVDEATYAARHAEWRARSPLGADAPTPGEAITLRTRRQGSRETVFRAFSPGGVKVARDPDDPRWLAWSEIEALEHTDGRAIPLERLVEADRAAELPRGVDFELTLGRERRRVPADDVRAVIVPGYHSKQWATGLLVGLGVDLLVVAGVAASHDAGAFGWE